ncbi:MAG: peptidoglycan-binding domain-containing protein [Pseudomonadota bacterium]
MSNPAQSRVRAIKNSVGERAVNSRTDVRTVQALLNRPGNQPPVPFRATRLEVDGVCGPLTVQSIKTYQAQVMRWGARSVDGRVDPGGKTWTALNGNVAASTRIQPRSLTQGTLNAVENALGPPPGKSKESEATKPIVVAPRGGPPTRGIFSGGIFSGLLASFQSGPTGGAQQGASSSQTLSATAPGPSGSVGTSAPIAVTGATARTDATPGSNPQQVLPAAYKAYRQGDYKKTLGHRYGGDADNDGIQDKSKTISGYGCALTTLTMAATRIGTPTEHWPKDLEPKDLDPLKANTILKKAGAYTKYMLFMEKAARELGMVPDQYGFQSVAVPADGAEKIIAHLKTDRPVAAHVDYKGGASGDHWVLLTDANGSGTVTGIDPATGKKMTFAKQRNISPRHKDTTRGVLFGSSGSANQKNYGITRYILLSEISGTAAAVH